MKAAILIDGGYFLKRLGSVRRDVDMLNAEIVSAQTYFAIQTRRAELIEGLHSPSLRAASEAIQCAIR